MVDHGLSSESPDPLMPLTSRFPLSPGAGSFVPSLALPSGPDTRPFGMRFAVRPVEAGAHDKKPTQEPKTKETERTKDGQESGTEPDTEHYIQMDEE
jgi:hypothetical protein